MTAKVTLGSWAAGSAGLLKKGVKKVNICWEGGLLDLGGEIWGEEPSQQK